MPATCWLIIGSVNAGESTPASPSINASRVLQTGWAPGFPVVRVVGHRVDGSKILSKDEHRLVATTPFLAALETASHNGGTGFRTFDNFAVPSPSLRRGRIKPDRYRGVNVGSDANGGRYHNAVLRGVLTPPSGDGNAVATPLKVAVGGETES